MAGSLHHMRVDLFEPCFLQRLGCFGQRLWRHHIISIAMHQKNWHSADHLIGQHVRFNQAARKGNDPGHRIFAARGDMQTHHGAL